MKSNYTLLASVLLSFTLLACDREMIEDPEAANDGQIQETEQLTQSETDLSDTNTNTQVNETETDLDTDDQIDEINTNTNTVTDETVSGLLSLASSVMFENSDLPVTYSCDGEGISPPLNWSGTPSNTQEFALVMHHIAGPDDEHTYWIMYNIDADIVQINAGEVNGLLGSNTVNGLNEYTAPCSQGPGVKSYTFTLYALSDTPNVQPAMQVDRETILAAIEDITIESSELNINFELFSEVDLTACERISQSVSEAGFSTDVGVTCDENYAYLASDTYPDHSLMNGITGTNEQIPVPATNYAAPIILNPEMSAQLTTIDAAIGVAVNGVPIYDYSSQGELDLYNYNAGSDTIVLGQLDECGGHAGRGDDYHYHASPNCMIDVMQNKGDQAIIGWGYDGYPIYGDNNPDGSLISQDDLDVCNGQSDDTYGYRYHTSQDAPYIVQCLVGQVDTSNLPRVSPLSGDNTGARADLTPPSGGVTNLVHTIDDNGTRTMTYNHNGEDYYVTYTPSTTQSDCYEFEQKTVSNGGIIEQGTFCRDTQIDTGDNDTDEEPISSMDEQTLKLEVWSDNWFAAYNESELIVEDSVSITTERSFNSETAIFNATYPITLNVIMKDFKENDTGLEYIGANNQQMGDGGFIAQITNTADNSLVAVSNDQWHCQLLHEAPLDKSCESESNPIAGIAPCTFEITQEPTDWKSRDYNASSWLRATQHTYADVSPKDGYDDIAWDSTAQFIWGEDLETNNTLICKVTIDQP